MKKAFRYVVFGIICVSLVIGYYYYLSHRFDNKTEEDSKTTVSEADSIVLKDFDNDYPATPRAVVKWYNRIITEYYAAEHSDKTIDQMITKQRALLDDELLRANPEQEFTLAVKADIEDYAARNRRIVVSKLCSSNDVTYATVNGYECAYVTSYYFTREGNDYTRTFQEYCLRKDSEGRWKILTFRLVDGDVEDYE